MEGTSGVVIAKRKEGIVDLKIGSVEWRMIRMVERGLGIL